MSTTHSLEQPTLRSRRFPRGFHVSNATIRSSGGALTWLRDQGEDFLLLKLASRLGRFWDARTHLREGRLWLEAALVNASSEATPEKAEALTRLGHIAWRQGDLAAAVPALDAAEEAARELGDVTMIGWLHTNRGAIAITTGDLVQARSEYEFALELFREIGADREIAIATHDLGLIAIEEGDHPRARRLLEESAETARTVSYRSAEANAIGSLSFLAFAQGDLAEAWNRAQEALRLDRAENWASVSVANDLVMIGQIVGVGGDPATACKLVGAFDAYLDLTGAALDPGPARQRSSVLLNAEEAIGRDAVDEACEAGRSLSLTEALDFALSIDSA